MAEAFGWGAAARAAGLMHDIGKASAAFQAYISSPRDAGSGRGPDHSTAGAREAVAAYPGQLGRVLAYAIAGHHAGPADAPDLDRRLAAGYPLEPYGGWREQTGPLPHIRELLPARQPVPSPHPGFSQAFLTRMLFSCLVDADFLETEAFYARANGRSLRGSVNAKLALSAGPPTRVPPRGARRGTLTRARGG